MFRSLAPGFLLATPILQDPNFSKTVVLMFHHTKQGALGLIINRPTDKKLQDLLNEAKIKPANKEIGEIPICFGGPVSLSSGWVIFEGHDPKNQSFHVQGDLRVTGSLDVFRDLISLPQPPRMMFCLGYSGWGAGQLDAEVASGAWLPIPLDLRIIFEVDMADRWRRGFLGVGIDPTMWSFQKGLG